MSGKGYVSPYESRKIAFRELQNRSDSVMFFNIRIFNIVFRRESFVVDFSTEDDVIFEMLAQYSSEQF